jgi:nitroimidazol reductase NimA-like FMN-containing flavoprotein (pyridoxamine 5'-phosphate oxidase superfamily)
MSKNYATQLPTEMRRADRAVEDEAWIRAFLHEAPLGFLATSYEDQPFLNSNLFVYDEARGAIYLHTANVGRTKANVAHNARVCFSVATMGRLLPAEEALEFSVEYGSVVVFGRASAADDPAEAEAALQLLLDKYAPHLRPGRDYRPITPEELKRTGVIRLDIEAWTGKKKEVAADFPGAFDYLSPGTGTV